MARDFKNDFFDGPFFRIHCLAAKVWCMVLAHHFFLHCWILNKEMSLKIIAPLFCVRFSQQNTKHTTFFTHTHTRPADPAKKHWKPVKVMKVTNWGRDS